MNPMKPFEESFIFKRSSAPSIDNDSENKTFEDIVIQKTSVINKKKPKIKRFSQMTTPSTFANLEDNTNNPFDKVPEEIIEVNEEVKPFKEVKRSEPIIASVYQFNETDTKKSEPIKTNLFQFDDSQTKKPEPVITNIFQSDNTETKKPELAKKKNLFAFDDNDDEDFKPKISKPKEEKNKVKLIFED
jgi:hypothetical protein